MHSLNIHMKCFFLDKGCYDIVKKHLNKKATGLQLQLGHLQNKTERKLK